MSFDVERARARFPALGLRDDGVARIYLDNPAGTQVPSSVLDRMGDAMVRANANLGGAFRTSVVAGEIVAEAHAAMADLLGGEPDEIVFGQNMTSLTFHVSRSIGRAVGPGDEIVVTRMDHDANVWPWVMLAEDRGAHVRWLPFSPATYTFDLDDLDAVLSDRTRLVAVGYASNLIGTINDVPAICERAHAVGADVFVDAVQFVPHGVTDVGRLGCDYLVCSAYKFFGPHQGILWSRRDRLAALEPYKVRPAGGGAGARFETGTQSHEGMSGTTAAVDYLASIGAEVGTAPADAPRRVRIEAGLHAIDAYERALTRRLLDGLEAMPGVVVRGITDRRALDRRVPTVALTVDGHDPASLARSLAAENIFVWSGHSYAVEVVEHLGLADRGGVLRVGPVHYNTAEEIDRFLAVLDRLIA